jgi:flagellin
MAFSINTNIASLQAQNYLRASSDFQSKTINKVTSGLRIVQSGDDAAGLAIANGVRSDEAVLSQGIRNANDGLSTLQTIDSGMSNISKLLDRARTLATQSASGTFTGDRTVLNSEFQSTMTEIDRQAQAIGLNKSGMFAKSLQVFIGGGKGATSASVISNGSASVDLTNSTVDTTSLGLNTLRAANSAYDLGTDSSTSVSSILKNSFNTASEATTGKVKFTFQGAGFADSGKITIDVNVAGVKDTASLVTAINTAIETAANPTTPTTQATAFKNAGITASIVTDSNGREQLAFSAPSSAFQVRAGDLTANALLGNFEGTDGRGATLNTYYTGAAVAAAATGGTEALIVNGKTLSLGTIAAGTSVQGRADAFNTAIAATGDTTLQNNFHAYVEDGSKIRIENVNGDSFTLAATLATQGDYGLSGTASVTSYAVTAGTAMAAAVDNYIYTGTAAMSATATGGSEVITIAGTAVTATITASDTSAGLAASVQAAIDANGTLSGHYSAADNAGTLVITNIDAVPVTFTVGGDALAMADLGVDDAASAGSATHTVTGGATGGSEIVTIADSAGTHALTVTAAASDSPSVLVTKLQAAIDADAATVGRYTASQDATHHLIITATGAAASFTVAANAEAVTDMQLAAGPTTAATSTVTTSATATSTQSNAVDSGGAQISTQFGDTQAYSWTAFTTGSQDITFSGSHADGTQYTWTTTLNATNASNLDNAVSALNAALQASSDTSLKKIVAVKDAGTSGALGIRFMSSDEFSAKLGAATNPGEGLADTSLGAVTNGQGAILMSDTSAGAGAVDISNQAAAKSAVSDLATAVSSLGNAQAAVGKGQNTFNFAVDLAQSQVTNLAAAESRIRDADLASEAANLSKAQILIQAGTAALAQANSAPQAILSLLKG